VERRWRDLNAGNTVTNGRKEQDQSAENDSTRVGVLCECVCTGQAELKRQRVEVSKDGV
jgi:hypothetical protein